MQESILTLVHDEQCAWLLPGVKPTSKRICVPMVTVARLSAAGLVQEMRVYWVLLLLLFVFNCVIFNVF